MDAFTSRLCLGGLCDLNTIDPVDRVVEQLITGAASVRDPAVWAQVGCGYPGRPGGRVGCALAEWGSPFYRAAVLTALAARYLLSPGLVTASVLGSGTATHIQLTLIARHVPDVCHVAVCSDDGTSVDPRVVDELDLAGIAMATTRSRDEAVFGATLVVVTGAGSFTTSPVHLADGAVLVNASDQDLPDALLDRVSQVFVDDLALLDAPARHRPSSADRLPGRARRDFPVEADLRQVLTGEHPGRQRPEHVLLVELLSTRTPACPRVR